MHDGQMLFDSTNSWNHTEWGVDETMAQLISGKKINSCIVVGIWNAGKERHADYFPQKPFESLTVSQQDSLYNANRTNGNSVFNQYKVHSNAYLKFLVEELKPFIDAHYATLTDREHTFVAGSSMGGLISLYAICEYPELFGGAACLSTHWPGVFAKENNPIPDEFYAYMQQHLPDPATHKIYFDYGDQTLDALYPPLQQKADAVMKAKGYNESSWQTLFFPGENHSEISWSKRLHLPIQFLMKK
jgi:enterochelin esterase-like enzyme